VCTNLSGRSKSEKGDLMIDRWQSVLPHKYALFYIHSWTTYADSYVIFLSHAVVKSTMRPVSELWINRVLYDVVWGKITVQSHGITCCCASEARRLDSQAIHMFQLCLCAQTYVEYTDLCTRVSDRSQYLLAFPVFARVKAAPRFLGQ
jgi:hypothetical protein